MSDFPPSGKLADGRDYQVHGVGCCVRSKGRTIDFDFGANGEIDGFCVYRLSTFLGANPRKFGFTSHAEMQEHFRAAIPGFRSSGDRLYYLDTDVETGGSVPG